MKKEAKQLIKICRDAHTSTTLLDEIVEEHLDCVEDELCETCEYLEDEVGEKVITLVAANPHLSKESQEKLLEASFEWQGLTTDYLLVIVTNPNISDSLKKSVVNYSFVNADTGEDGQAVATEVLAKLRANPRFNDKDIKEFIDNYEEFNFPSNWAR